MFSCFAIIPDGKNEPAALFADFRDAMDWGLTTFGNRGFRVRFLKVAQVESSDRETALSALIAESRH
jgi:hypothetical protein